MDKRKLADRKDLIALGLFLLFIAFLVWVCLNVRMS